MILPKIDPILMNEGRSLTQRFRSATLGIGDRKNIGLRFRMKPTTDRTDVLRHALTPRRQATTLKLFGSMVDVVMKLVQLTDHVENARIGNVEFVQKSTINRRLRPDSQQMQTLEFGEASQPLALMTKVKRSDVKFGATMGPLKLLEPSHHTFATRSLESMRSVSSGGVGQIAIFGNDTEGPSEDRVEQSLKTVPLRLDVGNFGEVGNEI